MYFDFERPLSPFVIVLAALSSVCFTSAVLTESWGLFSDLLLFWGGLLAAPDLWVQPLSRRLDIWAVRVAPGWIHRGDRLGRSLLQWSPQIRRVLYIHAAYLAAVIAAGTAGGPTEVPLSPLVAAESLGVPAFTISAGLLVLGLPVAVFAHVCEHLARKPKPGGDLHLDPVITSNEIADALRSPRGRLIAMTLVTAGFLGQLSPAAVHSLTSVLS